MEVDEENDELVNESKNYAALTHAILEEIKE